MPARQLVIDHASREGITERTGWDDWDQIRKWNEEDWAVERGSVISRIQTMRFRAIDKAMKKGQLQTVAQLLADMGKVVGESVETINVQAPELSIKVEKKKS
jgi:hypothetical protein